MLRLARALATILLLGLLLPLSPAHAANADVTFTITNGGKDTKGTSASGAFHIFQAGNHNNGITWGNSDDHVQVPEGTYDVQINFSDGAANKEVWLNGLKFSGTFARTIEIGIPIADVTYTVTNGGKDTKGTNAGGAFHIFQAGNHNNGITWGNSGDHVRLPQGTYDVQITFSDGAANKEIWLNSQDFGATAAKSIEIGMPVADVTYTITNGGKDTKGTGAAGQFHIFQAGNHNNGIAWGNSDDHVRVPAGTYDVQITFSYGSAQREIWLANQHFADHFAQTVEAGIATADVTYTITNGGKDTKGTGATGQFHIFQAGNHNNGIAWGNSDDHVRVPAGTYDVQITYARGLVNKTIWLNSQVFANTFEKTVELGLIFTRPTVAVTQDGTDLGDKATVVYLHPGTNISLGGVRSGEQALLEQGSYDIHAFYDGAEGWLRNQALSGAPHLTIAVVKPKVQTLTAGAPPPLACTIEVYGVNFDFDKSTLRPEAEPVLHQVLALFTSIPGFAAEVGGHTDNIGTEAYNMRLSQARAEAVRDWLIRHGVAAARIEARGYGDTRPLVPNTSDANRFKNRRVELRRRNCT
ncbi:MAG: OmpA family protein [Rhodospirillales bacterium]|nr:OmpA family protein [Rhodospirillales bacterium]